MEIPAAPSCLSEKRAETARPKPGSHIAHFDPVLL